MKKINIGIVTTIDHNIGDDFVRVGIQNIFNFIYADYSINYILVNKHEPLSVLYSNCLLNYVSRLTHLMPRGRRIAEDLLFLIFGPRTRFDNCQVLIQSGAPVIFSGCSTTEWSNILWIKTFGRLSKKKGVVIFNLAAGSCFSYAQKDSVNLADRDKNFLSKIYSYCDLMTVRDGLAGKMMDKLGLGCEALPCTALLAGMGRSSKANADSPVLVNFMAIAGHYDFENKINRSDYLKEFKKVIDELAKKHDLLFVAHTQEEKMLFENFFKGHKVILPLNVSEYFNVIEGVKFGVTNRLHCAVALASLGINSYSIGNDTRLLMLKQLGLEYCDVEDFRAKTATEFVELSLTNGIINEKLVNLRDATFDRYVNLLKDKLVI